MTECGYCEEEFSSEKQNLEHQLEEHREEMSGHDESDKKSELNRLEQQKKTNKHNRKKKLKYSAVGILLIGLVAGGGFYTFQGLDSDSPVQQNNASTGVGTPVHWHASYTISVCGEKKVLSGGPKLAHTHGETKFHLEGVRRNSEQATLDWIVDRLGAQLENDSIMGKTSCNGSPGNLTVKVNGNKVENHLGYIVQDGDFIKIKYS